MKPDKRVQSNFYLFFLPALVSVPILRTMRTLTLVAIAASFLLACGSLVDQNEHEKEHHPCKDCRKVMETVKQALPTLEGTQLVIFDSAIRVCTF